MGTFGRRLRELRARAGLSQRELGERAGIRENYIARIERGERDNPTRETIEALALALKVRPSAFYPDQSPTPVAEILQDLAERCRILETSSIPLRGTVPGEVREHAEEYIEVPRARIGEEYGEVYALEVVEPLADEGIDAGDYVVITPGDSVVEAGGIYIISVGGENALRRAWRVGSHLHIRPDVNGATVLQAADVSVIGRVVLGGRWREF